MNNSTNVTICDLKNFSNGFRAYHIYLSFTVCIFGSILNILNIIVLCSKQMRCPTNHILTSLAVADVLVMLEYIPFAYLEDNKSKFYFTYNFAQFLIFHAVFTNAFHFIACCLAIILAVWRYIAVKFPQNNQKWCSDQRTKITISLTYLLCPLVCIPLILSGEIKEHHAYVDPNGTIIFKRNAALNLTNTSIYTASYSSGIFKDISFLVYGVVIKLVPCALLVLLSVLLIIELLKAKQRKKALHSEAKEKKKEGGAAKKINQRHLDREKQFDRTTKMLLAVLLLFLMAEFPQAIFGLLNYIFGEKFYLECYVRLGDLLDIFTLTISAINFILYCIMSQKFREVFKELFFPFKKTNKKTQWISLQTVNSHV